MDELEFIWKAVTGPAHCPAKKDVRVLFIGSFHPLDRQMFLTLVLFSCLLVQSLDSEVLTRSSMGDLPSKALEKMDEARGHLAKNRLECPSWNRKQPTGDKWPLGQT
jgi:hypothetical protein